VLLNRASEHAKAGETLAKQRLVRDLELGRYLREGVTGLATMS
jgi:hypothetical protein